MPQILMDILQPALSQVVTALAIALVSYIAYLIKRYTGIEVEARYREGLQSALANAGILVAKTGNIQDGVDYVLGSVPDALKALSVDGAARIEELLAPHVTRAEKG